MTTAEVVKSVRPENSWRAQRPEYIGYVGCPHGSWNRFATLTQTDLVGSKWRPQTEHYEVRIPSEAECKWRKEYDALTEDIVRRTRDYMRKPSDAGFEIVDLIKRRDDMAAAHPEWAKEE